MARPLTMVGRRRVNHRPTDPYDAGASQTALGVSAGANDLTVETTASRWRRDSRRVAFLGDDRSMVGVQIRPCYGPTYVIPVDEDLGEEEESHCGRHRRHTRSRTATTNPNAANAPTNTTTPHAILSTVPPHHPLVHSAVILVIAGPSPS